MLRDRKRLSPGFDEGEPPDPMEGLGNLSDVMLVFACGLMVALIINLNVDVSRLDQAVVHYKDEGATSSTVQSAGAGMEEVGTVYKDPKTGKTYITDAKKK